MMKKIVFILGIAVLMISCNKMHEGEIVEKWHEEESMDLILIPMKVGKITIMQQYWVHDDEDFCIKIEGINEKGKVRRKTIYLPSTRWDTVKVGQVFCVDENCETQDEDEKTKAEE